ncbi:MAG TPA: DUF5683 domain-containing protein [Flavisolibacter sp.]|nr:DUF5683 domain-containing protein [Flavisolibacter sp.]
MSKVRRYRSRSLLLFCCLAAVKLSFAQDDSTGRKVPVDSLPAVATPVANPGKIDSVLKNHSPRKAAIRSAILPGLGQIYNKKYWKLPIVYGALAISGSVFIYNLRNYRDLRFAYRARIQAEPPPVGTGDSSGLPNIDPLLRNLDINAIRSYRDEFRRNIDYSALVFLLLWGLNVVDATVDAHLKSFDVSPDLSFKIKLGPSQMAGTNGVSLVMAFK